MKELLLDCLHQDPTRFPDKKLAGLNSSQWTSLGGLAAEHRVVPLLHHRLTEGGMPVGTHDEKSASSIWAEARRSGPAVKAIDNLGQYARQVARNNLVFFAELQRYLGLLQEADIPVILLKGIWLAHDVYPGKGLREMNDIDLLFHTEDLPQAQSILAEMGYTAERPARIDLEIKKSHHLPPMIRKGVAVVELHWNITRPGLHYSIDPAGLWQRATPATITGKHARLLGPEDQLLHLCLHTSYQHMFSFGLRPYCDIAQTIRHFGDDLDWHTFTRRASRSKWTKGVWLALKMSRTLLGADVPGQVLANMEPTGTNPSITEIGELQLFTPKAIAASVPLQMAGMVSQKNAAANLKNLGAGIFLTRENMADRYALQPGSKKIYLYYLIRLTQLTLRHSIRLLRIYTGDKTLSGVASRKNSLEQWMRE